MIDRRTFVILSGAAALFLALPKSVIAAERLARLVKIITYVPRRIFFSTKLPGSPVLLGSLKLINEDKTVSCSFSNSQTVQLGSNTSSLNIVQKNKGRRVTRQSVLLRSLAAWVIDAVWQSVRNKRNSKTIAQLRGNFEGFQRQSVLDNVTPISLYHLVRDTLTLHQITFVTWDKEARRFEVK